MLNMPRLFLLALAVAALTQTAPAQDAVEAVSDYREHQYVTGKRVGCQMQLIVALRDQDIERVSQLEGACAELARATGA